MHFSIQNITCELRYWWSSPNNHCIQYAQNYYFFFTWLRANVLSFKLVFPQMVAWSSPNNHYIQYAQNYYYFYLVEGRCLIFEAALPTNDCLTQRLWLPIIRLFRDSRLFIKLLEHFLGHILLFLLNKFTIFYLSFSPPSAIFKGKVFFFQTGS